MATSSFLILSLSQLLLALMVLGLVLLDSAADSVVELAAAVLAAVSAAVVVAARKAFKDKLNVIEQLVIV